MWPRCFLTGLLLCAVGCGGGPQRAAVSGQVTLDGKPLANADVSFYPQNVPTGSEGYVPSTGKTNQNGEYTLETTKQQPGAVVGPHRVSITCLAEDVGDSDARPKRAGRGVPMKDKIPARYQGKDSELKFEVLPQDNRADFNLKSK